MEQKKKKGGKEKSKMDGEVVEEDRDKKRINCLIYLYSCYQSVRRRSLKHATHKYAFVTAEKLPV